MIILVTGATAGFGESITRRFVANGHKVIATGRRQERLQELKDELGDSILTAQLDVRNRAAIEEMIANLPAEWREIDVLVNNAGLALGMEPAHKASVEDWENIPGTDVEPGLVGGTEFTNVRFKGDDAKADKTYENANALTPEDITETVWWVANLPKHVNINTVEMMPVSQTYAGLSVHRGYFTPPGLRAGSVMAGKRMVV